MPEPRKLHGFTIHPCGPRSWAGIQGFRWESKANFHNPSSRYSTGGFLYAKTLEEMRETIRWHASQETWPGRDAL